VKHDLVDDPKKWEHSTLHRFIKNGMYPEDWGDSISDEVLRMDVE